MGGKSHEQLRAQEVLEPGSDRAFGLTMAALLGVVGLHNVFFGFRFAGWLIAAGALALASVTTPKLLRPFNWLWFRFGLAMHAVVNPLVLGLMFFGAIVPVGLLMRALGKRPLSLPFEPGTASYWTKREPPGPRSDSFKNQF